MKPTPVIKHSLHSIFFSTMPFTSVVLMVAWITFLPMLASAETPSTPSSSVSSNPVPVLPDPPLVDPPEGETTVTFSEFPVGASITNQYQGVGIIFGGDSPFITTDRHNPTSPALTGTPLFFGDIEGTFVDPATGDPAPVSYFFLDAGYFDGIGTTKLSWYNESNQLLGSLLNEAKGIFTYVVAGDDEEIVRWRIEPTSKKDEAGFGIDNVTFTPPDATKDDDLNEGEQECPAANAGDPIHTGTGNLLRKETDFELPAYTGLYLTRFYNSRDQSATPFGANWVSNWHRSVNLPMKGKKAAYTREDGRVETSTLNEFGGWEGNPSVINQLIPIYNKGGNHRIGWNVKREDDTTENYDKDGVLQSITTREGLTTVLAYDRNDLLQTVTGPFGHTLTFGYNESGLIETVTLPDGGVLTYGYDASDNLTSVTYPDNAVRQYLYNEPAQTENTDLPHALTGIIDENGARYATFGYDSQNRAVSTPHENGSQSVTVAYHADDTVTVTDPLGNSHGYSLDSVLGVVKPTEVTGAPVPTAGGQAFTFDSLTGKMTSRLDFNGNLDCRTYDTVRKLELARVEGFAPGSTCPSDLANYTPAAGTTERVITWQWHPTYRLPQQITEASAVPGVNQVTSFVHDDMGNVLTQTVTAGSQARTWAYTYNSVGQVLSVDGPRTDVADLTTFTYGPAGGLATISDALGNTTSIPNYDANGRPLIIQDPNGVVTTLAYDAKGRLVSRTVDQELTTYEYDAANQLKKVTLPDGASLNYTYNNVHQLTRITDSLGNYIDYTLDAAGNVINEQVFDPANVLVRTRSQTYDEVNRLASTIGAAGQTTSFQRDGNGNIIAITNPNNYTTTNGYDALNRLSTSIDPNNGTSTIDYNPDDSVANVTDPRSVATHYDYDGLGNQTSIQSPDSGTTVQTFDEAGNLKTRTDARGVTVEYDYDALNRLTAIRYPDPQENVTLTYDHCLFGIGRLCSVSDESGVASFQYDAYGNLTNFSEARDGVNYSQSYQYDAGRRVVAMTLPSGRQVDYLRDSLGRIQRITAAFDGGSHIVLDNVGYNADDQVIQRSYGNGLTDTRLYNLQGELLSQDLGAVNQTSLSYDANSNILTRNTTSDTHSYDYDPLDRLMGEVNNADTLGYIYDSNGNRTLKTNLSAPDIVYDYALDSNRLDAINSIPLLYDNAGNLIQDAQGRQYFYNGAGRLTEIQYNSQALAQYRYNSNGQRTRKITGTQTTQYHYDLVGNLIGETQADGTPIRDYIRYVNEPVAQIDRDAGGTETIVYLHGDHLGTPRLATDPTQIIAWRWEGEAFGNTPAQNLGTTVNLRFPGQYYDLESGLHYNYFRYYDPNTGKYITSDPIGLFGGLNTYLYAKANPTRFIDPSGLIAGVDDATIFIGGTAIVIGCALSQGCTGLLAEAAESCVNIVINASNAINDAIKRMFSERRLPLDKGGEEWGRRNGVGADEGRRRAHGIKQDDNMSGATDKYTVDPDTGDVYDPEGEYVGNLGNDY